MMADASASVPTASASRYLQQLCKHWSHKLEVEFDAAQGRVGFPDATLTLAASDDRLDLVLEADDPAMVERLKGVVAEHIDRFAFRKGPLSYDWR